MGVMLVWRLRARSMAAPWAMLAVLGALAALWAPGHAHAGRLEHHGIPMPPGSRSASGDVVQSSRGFARTVGYYERFFKRTGHKHDQVPVYRYRGVDVARFISRQEGSRWAAIHVFRHGGRTMIYVVPRGP